MTDVTDTTPAEESAGFVAPAPEPRFAEVTDIGSLIDKVVTELRSAASDSVAVQQLADDLNNERGDIAAAVEGEPAAEAEAESAESGSSKSSKAKKAT